MKAGTKKALAWGALALGVVGGLVAFFWPGRALASSGGSSMSVSEIQNMLRRVFAGSRIPVWFAFAVAELESGFGRAPYGDNHRSYGIFHLFWPVQRSTAQGLGINDPEQFVTDPELCATFWRDHVAGVFARAVGATVDDPESWERVRLRLAGAGGRDGLPDTPDDERRLARYRPVAGKWLVREVQGAL